MELTIIVDGATFCPEAKIKEAVDKLFEENRLSPSKDYVVTITVKPSDAYIS